MGELAELVKQEDARAAAAMADVINNGGALIRSAEFDKDARAAVQKARRLRRQLAGRSVVYIGANDKVWLTFTPIVQGSVYQVANIIDPGAGTIGLNVRLPNNEIVALNMTKLTLVD